MNRGIWLVALLACHAACRGKQTPPPPPPVDKLAVTLVSPGAEPRKLLRYAVAKGSESQVELALDASLTTGELGGAMPTFVFDVDSVVEDVLPDGRMQLRTTIVSAGARDRPEAKITAKQVQSHLEIMKGIAITGTLSSDGKLVGAAVDPTTTAKLPPQTVQQLQSLTSSFENIAMPLPVAAVGVGAKWTTTRELELNGMHTTTTNTVELTSLDGDKVGFQLTTEIHGPEQTVQQGTTTVEVKKLDGTGTGKGTIDLAHFAMTGVIEAKLHAEMTALGQSAPLDLSTTTTLTAK